MVSVVAKRMQFAAARTGWPDAPAGRDVVLHTRVVTGTGGGPDKTILMSAAHLAQSNYWLAAAYMHPPDDPGFDTIRQRAAAYGSPLISVPDKGPLDRGVLRQMLALCRHYNVRIWHGHDYKSNLIGLLLRPFWSMKLVTTVHGWVRRTARTPLYYAVDRWSLPYYHHVICVSQDLVDRVRGLNVPAERCTYVPNAVDHQRFARRGRACDAAMREAVGTPAGRLVVGAVGRLSAEKGFNLLIRTVRALVDEGHDLELWIAGEGDGHDELVKLIAHLGLADRVRLLGFVEDTVALYEAMDLFVLSSLREGLPNVVLEAMSMGVTVVSTEVAGVPGLVVDEQTGLLCPIADQAALTEAVRRGVADERLRASLASAARSLIEREYSFAVRMQRVRAIYDRVLADEPASPRDAEP